jgi:uncharacterized membrane protein
MRGRLLFAVGFAGLGVLSLLSGDFALVWQPVPTWVPWREVLARMSGILLLAAGIGMLVKRAARVSTLVMTLFLVSWLLLLQVPRVVSDPKNVGMWLGFAENMVSVTGGWLLYASLAGTKRDTRVAQLLFGAACLVLGLSHFVYAEGTAGMVPAWLPARLGIAYLTGAGHFAAGLGILFGVVPGLAATLEAIMISSFVLLLHIPSVIGDPKSRMQWTMMFIATALAGGAWSVAASIQVPSWAWARKLKPSFLQAA